MASFAISQGKRYVRPGCCRLTFFATLSGAAVISTPALAASRHVRHDKRVLDYSEDQQINQNCQVECDAGAKGHHDPTLASPRFLSRCALRRGEFVLTVGLVSLLAAACGGGGGGSGSGSTSDGGVVAANQVPVAAFMSTGSGSEYTFDASGSYDADGQIDNYAWDFGDGSISQGSPLTSHTYLADGGYQVVLTVTDNGGESSNVTQTVTVNSSSNASPSAQFTMNTTSGAAPLTVTFDASPSSDDGQIASYEWNFGDGSATDSGRTAMHIYNQAGNYTVTLRVTDDGGFSASTEKPVVVTAAPPPGAIWQPTPGTSWQWQLTGTIDTSFDVQMYDIDLFDTPKSTIDTLHGQGRVVICYFSAGSWEDWRPDAADFPANVKGNSNGWPGEKWLDIRNIAALSPIMQARLDLAVDKGCDGVEPDNVDGYSNKTGFPLTGNDQLTYNRWLADQAHARGLSVGLKNDVEQVTQLEPYFNWALDEQCFEYNECDLLLPFVQAGKAVFGVEYSGSLASFCPEANSMDFDWLKKNENLNASREACR